MEVTIDTGALRGKVLQSRSGRNIAFFGGIPYAAPPIGELRWQAPQPPAAWEGVRDASEYGPSCPQLVVRGEGTFRDTIARAIDYAIEERDWAQDEDCLCLNVFTPDVDSATRRPVMVWVHGGAHRNGTSSAYPGEELAAKGVVLVTINYRLGPLGFLAHPELTAEGCRGNQGLLDTVAALQWVQRNIRRFGGDPGNVTVFGESAGGHSTCAMVTSPLCEGLIHRAIAQSGVGAQATMLLDRPGANPISAEQAGVKLGEAMGCPAGPGQLAAMRQLTAGEIIERTAAVPLPGVIIDGYCQVENPVTAFRKDNQNPVDLMIGSNAFEGSALYWGAPMAQMRICRDTETYLAEINRVFAEDAEEALLLYPASDEAEMVHSSKRMCGDSLFGAPTRAVVQALSEQDRPAWAYYFTHTPDGDDGKLGAFHAMEISYVFGVDFLSPLKSDADKALSERMMNYWVNFATTGNPNGAGLPRWDRYDSNADTMMNFGSKIGMARVALPREYDLIMRAIDRQLAAVE
ncbi:MAG: carboxylesterase/lipase family protein [Pseudomonadales bacterium]